MIILRDRKGEIMKSEFEAFIKNYPEPVQLIAFQLRKLILSELPGTMEMVDAPSKIIAYGASAKYANLVCAIAPYPKYVNLMFSRGASIPDPDGILKGTGKKARHIRVEEMTEQIEGQIKKYLQAATQGGK
jgi:hypothetical protein